MKSLRGFTLIEVMIVIAIVGIVAAIALPAYQDYIACRDNGICKEDIVKQTPEEMMDAHVRKFFAPMGDIQVECYENDQCMAVFRSEYDNAMHTQFAYCHWRYGECRGNSG